MHWSITCVVWLGAGIFLINLSSKRFVFGQKACEKWFSIEKSLTSYVSNVYSTVKYSFCYVVNDGHHLE